VGNSEHDSWQFYPMLKIMLSLFYREGFCVILYLLLGSLSTTPPLWCIALQARNRFVLIKRLSECSNRLTFMEGISRDGAI